MLVSYFWEIPQLAIIGGLSAVVLVMSRPQEAKSRGNQAKASKSHLSAVIQDGLNFSSNELDNSHEKSAKKIHYRLSSQSFYWGLLT